MEFTAVDAPIVWHELLNVIPFGAEEVCMVPSVCVVFAELTPGNPTFVVAAWISYGLTLTNEQRPEADYSRETTWFEDEQGQFLFWQTFLEPWIVEMFGEIRFEGKLSWKPRGCFEVIMHLTALFVGRSGKGRKRESFFECSFILLGCSFSLILECYSCLRRFFVRRDTSSWT